MPFVATVGALVQVEHKELENIGPARGRALPLLRGAFPAACFMAGHGEMLGEGCVSRDVPQEQSTVCVGRGLVCAPQGWLGKTWPPLHPHLTFWIWAEADKTPRASLCVTAALEATQMGFNNCSKPKGRLASSWLARGTPKPSCPPAGEDPAGNS